MQRYHNSWTTTFTMNTHCANLTRDRLRWIVRWSWWATAGVEARWRQTTKLHFNVMSQRFHQHSFSSDKRLVNCSVWWLTFHPW